MTVKELYDILNSRIPTSLSCDWDNDGLMCCPDNDREVKKVLVTLDITDKAISKAIEEECDLIVAHHPLIFKGIKSLASENAVQKRTIKLIKNSIAAFSFHTRLDALEGGVNDRLAKLIGISDASPFGEEGIGRIGTVENALTADEFAAHVKERLSAPSVILADAGKKVKRVAVLGGGGSDDIQAAITAGADTFVSGDLSYHAMVDAAEEEMNLIAAGHFFTEFPVCEVLSDLIGDADSTIERIIFFSNEIKTI